MTTLICVDGPAKGKTFTLQGRGGRWDRHTIVRVPLEITPRIVEDASPDKEFVETHSAMYVVEKFHFIDSQLEGQVVVEFLRYHSTTLPQVLSLLLAEYSESMSAKEHMRKNG